MSDFDPINFLGQSSRLFADKICCVADKPEGRKGSTCEDDRKHQDERPSHFLFLELVVQRFCKLSPLARTR